MRWRSRLGPCNRDVFIPKLAWTFVETLHEHFVQLADRGHGQIYLCSDPFIQLENCPT